MDIRVSGPDYTPQIPPFTERLPGKRGPPPNNEGCFQATLCQAPPLIGESLPRRQYLPPRSPLAPETGTPGLYGTVLECRLQLLGPQYLQHSDPQTSPEQEPDQVRVHEEDS